VGAVGGVERTADQAARESRRGDDVGDEADRVRLFGAQATGGYGMLVTARSRTGAAGETPGETDDRGVVGYATSADLQTWQVQAPLSEPGAGFAHLEVLQYVDIDGVTHAIFSCDAAALAGERGRASNARGGIWSVRVKGPGVPIDAGDASLLVDERLYAGRAVRGRDGEWYLLGFNNVTVDGGFGGRLSDPIALTVRDGRLALAELEVPAR